MAHLCVNIDHVATVRQARLTHEPDPVLAAAEAMKGGADGITGIWVSICGCVEIMCPAIGFPHTGAEGGVGFTGGWPCWGPVIQVST